MSGGVGERALLPPTRHPPVNQPGVARQTLLGAHAEPLGHTGAVPLHQHIGALDQRKHLRHPVGTLQVHQYGALVAVGDVVGRVDAQSRASGPVDTDDIGAEVGQEHGREGAGADAREFDHPHPVQWAVAWLCHRAPCLSAL